MWSSVSVVTKLNFQINSLEKKQKKKKQKNLKLKLKKIKNETKQNKQTVLPPSGNTARSPRYQCRSLQHSNRQYCKTHISQELELILKFILIIC